VLVAHARWQQIGAASGRLLFGALAWATTRSTAMVLDGSMMALLGLYVVTRCAEHHFTLTRTHQWRQAMTLLRRGVTLARHDHGVLVMFAATFLINRSWGCVRAVVCQTPPWPRRATRRRSNRVVHRARIVAFAVGALALRRVEARIAGAGLTRRVYAVACGIGTLGVLLLAAAPDVVSGSAGVLMVTGIAWTVTCAVAAIWVNRRTTSEVRATVHSFLAQMEYGGEIVCGAVLSVLAQATSITGALVGACALVAGAGMVVKVGPFVKIPLANPISAVPR
jgi:hypothetical protein